MFLFFTNDVLASDYQKEFHARVEKFAKEKIQKGKVSREKIEMIYLILQNTPEYNIHKMNGEDENQIYVHKNGNEVVMDKSGNVIKNSPNAGSYNFYDPEESPLLHFKLDIEPWIKWGNYKEDPTSIDQRIDAYLMDFGIGIGKFWELKDKKVKEPKKFNDTESMVLAFFILAEMDSKSDLFKKISSHQTNLDAEFVKILNQFKKIYQEVE